MSFVTLVSRYILPILTLIIIIKCLLTLLLGQPKEKTYGYITDMTKGSRYPLNMWETSIGRSSSCDIIVSYAMISRFHAVISRRIDGWYIYDLNSKAGIKVNGESIDRRATINAGDILCFGGINYRFDIINDPVQKVGKHKKNKKQPSSANFSQPAQRVQRYQPDPRQASAQRQFYESNRFRQEPDDSLFTFYDSDNRPELHFEKSSERPDFISERGSKKDIYSGSNHIQTPNRENSSRGKRIVVSRPMIINRDTNEAFILSGNIVSIGRSRNCDINVSSPTASRKHALLILYEDGWAIDDAGSASGTFLNGKRVSSPQLLFKGDIISVGDDRLYYNS